MASTNPAFFTQVPKRALWGLDKILLGGRLRRARRDWLVEKKIEALRSGLPYRIESHYKRAPGNTLSILCDFYGSDKGEVTGENNPYPWPSHTYTDYLSQLFGHCRESVRGVFECGIGTNSPQIPSSMGLAGRPGASLRVWRDYFPNAQVYGADIDETILFTEERISTYCVDQKDPTLIVKMWNKIARKVDLIVDDGLHEFEAAKTLFENSIEHLEDNGIYIIEDVRSQEFSNFYQYFSEVGFPFQVVLLHRENQPLADNSLIVIRKQL